MTEWEVVGVLVVLVGLFGALMKPILKNNTTLTELAQTVKTIAKDLQETADRNSKTHARIFDAIEAADDKLADHEKRITVLERDKP